ncbi:35720_t:CDS:1 [Gigaspora margarita]|uniref:35720_t:CDS:1 n=1 Tax=Gigaspora margarita TaxID=4874 RepID=A0ABM8VY03_GIGMA|nr:35720_t:CDS:1 [Gigaspora margarita]
MQIQKGEVTISFNGTIEKHSIKSLDEKYTNGRNFEIDLFNFLKRKGYNMMLSDSHPMNLNLRFFNLNNRWALQIGNYRITGDGDRDLIGDKNGIQIIIQAKFSKTGRYPKLEKEYKKFIRNMETRKSAKEIGIFVVTNNINIKKLEDITSTERKIIICTSMN